MPRVAFIIATYKRVDALRSALGSLLLQDHQDWTAIIVGDCCSDETADAIRDLRDARLHYYNLPRRFGEQSGPNTFGLHIAQGDFIAFLNHDDLLLRDHLVHALDRLASPRRDFFIGRFANITSLNSSVESAKDDVGGLATRQLPEHDDLRLLVHPDPYLFDPSSFWLTRMQLARRVGGWRPARTIWRTPARDWIMRCWRRAWGSHRFVFGERLTGVRFWTHNLRTGGPLYRHDTPEHDAMLRLIESHTSDALRARFAEQIAAAQRAGDRTFEATPIPPRTLRRHALLYRLLGIDCIARAARRQRQEPGSEMQRITQKRTGAALPEPWDIRTAMKNAAALRVL